MFSTSHVCHDRWRYRSRGLLLRERGVHLGQDRRRRLGRSLTELVDHGALCPIRDDDGPTFERGDRIP